VLSLLTLGQVDPDGVVPARGAAAPRRPQAPVRTETPALGRRERAGRRLFLCAVRSGGGERVGREGKRWPLVMSAAFSQTLSARDAEAVARRFFRLHFQYLCAFDRPGDYDYFRITAGPLTLGARFRGRAPSKSRIDVAVSGLPVRRRMTPPRPASRPDRRLALAPSRAVPPGRAVGPARAAVSREDGRVPDVVLPVGHAERARAGAAGAGGAAGGYPKSGACAEGLRPLLGRRCS
jgi:hypothetical protein